MIGETNWANWLCWGVDAIHFLWPSAWHQMIESYYLLSWRTRGRPENEDSETEGMLTHSYLICQHGWSYADSSVMWCLQGSNNPLFLLESMGTNDRWMWQSERFTSYYGVITVSYLLCTIPAKFWNLASGISLHSATTLSVRSATDIGVLVYPQTNWENHFFIDLALGVRGL